MQAMNDATWENKIKSNSALEDKSKRCTLKNDGYIRKISFLE